MNCFRRIEFGREICGELAAAQSREWLVTNGIGGYASGTVAGMLTRRYHGLLVAALAPPLGRTLLVAKLDETVSYDGREYSLSTNRWADGTVAPHGYRQIERFELDGTIPTWSFACADALITKRVWMEQGANTTYVRYDVVRASGPVTLRLVALVNCRDYHGVTRAGDWRMAVEPWPHGLRVTPYHGATPFYLITGRAEAVPAHDWYYGVDLAEERRRGLEDREDHLHAGTFTATLDPGESLTVALGTDPAPLLDGQAAWNARRVRERKLLDRRRASRPPDSNPDPAWVSHLVLAADQFIVDRPVPGEPAGKSVIAGYHWFGDWGRDTMIALPGLTLATGRPEVARAVLRTFAKYVDRGMLPNRFPDAGEAPEYNTVDAPLWYVEAIRAYHEATGDVGLVRELFPVLEDVVAWHVRGTRYGIGVDSGDGLLRAGEPGVQLTWMDAKVGDWVVTPRIGKPVEINALWYHGLRTLAEWAVLLGGGSHDYTALADRAAKGFERFWNARAGYCYDVLDGPEGDDPTLRPNQLFAVSLLHSPLTEDRQRAVVDRCGRRLLTSHGLRSLDPDHPHYVGRYGGDPRARDAAYHQGTVWGWLVGPFALAHLRVHRNPEQAAAFLLSMADQLTAYGLGTLAEICDGDAPFAPRGCVAQAWTVAEVLRAWTTIEASCGHRIVEERP